MTEAYQPLHHKYRPKRLDELVGQEAIAATLGNALRSGRIAPAYLFSGPRGTGKTSSARILARSLNCLASESPTPDPCGRCELCRSIASSTALDVIEIDAASNTGVDNIRELIERSRFAPVQARWKVYVVDECHMLSTAAFNALLKTLEEPPPRVVFVLATTDPQRVLPTILSRCQRFDFRRIPLAALENHLGWIAQEEGIAITSDALHLVAQRAQGGLRDAESLLDQLSLLPPPIEAAAVWDLLGAVPEEELLTLAEAMAGGDPLMVVETTRQLLERGREPTAVLQGLVSLLRDLLLAGEAPGRLELTSVSPHLRNNLPTVAKAIGKQRLLQWHAGLKGSEQQLRHSVQPRLWLEVLLLGLLAEPVAAPPRSSGSTGSSGSVDRPDPPGQGSPSSPLPKAEPTEPAPREGAPPPKAPPIQTSESPQNLEELWQQILAGLQLPSTRMLLSQQAHLRQLDGHRAVVQVASNWITMVQSRLPLLEKAMEATLGSSRTITLQASDQERPVATPAPAPPPAPAHSTNTATLKETAAADRPTPKSTDHQEAPEGSAAPGERMAAVDLGARPAVLETPPAQDKGPAETDPARSPEKPSESQTPQQQTTDERLLEESTGLLADFFNGQVIQDAGTVILQEKESHPPPDPKPGRDPKPGKE